MIIMSKKHKVIKNILLTTTFTIIFTACLIPVKQSSANPLLAFIVKAVTSDSVASSAVADKFDMLKSMLENNGYTMQDIKQDDPNVTAGQNKADTNKETYETAQASQDFKNNFDIETTPVRSDDWGVNFMNDVFGNDNLVFFQDENGRYDYISKPVGDDGFGFSDMLTEYLGNGIADSMENIMHPIDTLNDTAKNDYNKIFHPVEDIKEQFSFLNGESTYLDKFDNSKSTNKTNENEPTYDIANEKDWTEDYNLQIELMQDKLEIATDSMEKAEEHTNLQEDFMINTQLQEQQQQELQQNMEQFQQEQQQQQMLDIITK